MTYEEIYSNVVSVLDQYDISKLQSIPEIIDLHNDRKELDRLSNVYPDYYTLCNSSEFGRIKIKYCGEM